MAKGNITNIPIFIGLTLIVAITALTSSMILGEFQDATTDDQIEQEHLQSAQTAVGIFDIGLVMINASFYLAAIVLGSRIPTNRAFALPAILLLGLSVWFSSEVANLYYMFGETEPLSSYAAQFTFTETFMTNLPVITLGLGGLMIVALFAVGDNSGGREVVA